MAGCCCERRDSLRSQASIRAKGDTQHRVSAVCPIPAGRYTVGFRDTVGLSGVSRGIIEVAGHEKAKWAFSARKGRDFVLINRCITEALLDYAI